MGFCQGPLRITCAGVRNRRGNEEVGLQPGSHQSTRKAAGAPGCQLCLGLWGSNYEDSSSTVKDMWLELYESEVHNRNV